VTSSLPSSGAVVVGDGRGGVDKRASTMIEAELVAHSLSRRAHGDLSRAVAHS